MSSVTQALNSGQQAITNYDLSKIFIGHNRYQEKESVNNSGYDPITILQGTVMGRLAFDGSLVPWSSTALDGSQYPVGILAKGLEVDASDSANVTICDMGDVVEGKVVCYWVANGQSLDSLVSGRRLRDHLAAQGIKLVPVTEMTAYDNQ